jgi:hypothetical protein
VQKLSAEGIFHLVLIEPKGIPQTATEVHLRRPLLRKFLQRLGKLYRKGSIPIQSFKTSKIF